MSTAGKVLVVLSVLMLTVWVVLISAVAQLNMSALEGIEKLKADIVKFQADVERTEQTGEELRASVNDEQVAKERDIFIIRARLSTAERQLTTTRESLSRVQIQVENYNKALASARESQGLRNQEKTDLEKAKANEEALVKRLQGENAELLDTLGKLRTDFAEILKKNAVEVDRQLKGGKKPATVRAASLVR